MFHLNKTKSKKYKNSKGNGYNQGNKCDLERSCKKNNKKIKVDTS